MSSSKENTIIITNDTAQISSEIADAIGRLFYFEVHATTLEDAQAAGARAFALMALKTAELASSSSNDHFLRRKSTTGVSFAATLALDRVNKIVESTREDLRLLPLWRVWAGGDLSINCEPVPLKASDLRVGDQIWVEPRHFPVGSTNRVAVEIVHMTKHNVFAEGLCLDRYANRRHATAIPVDELGVVSRYGELHHVMAATWIKFGAPEFRIRRVLCLKTCVDTSATLRHKQITPRG